MKNTLYLGLDVHKDSITIAIAAAGRNGEGFREQAGWQSRPWPTHDVSCLQGCGELKEC